MHCNSVKSIIILSLSFTGQVVDDSDIVFIYCINKNIDIR